AQRYGFEVLHEIEVLELVLDAADQPDAFSAAEALIVRFGGLPAVLAADRSELVRTVSDQAAFSLKLARDIATRLAAAALPRRDLLGSSSHVSAFLRAQMVGLPREEFWVLFLDRLNRLIVCERLGRGTVSHVPVYPREVLRRALEVNASAMILAHNHPAGDPTPSAPDIEMTKQIVAAGKALDVQVWDHMIVGRDRVLSLKAEGLM
uniref:RadC family protein n=1 Tax=uncultured Caulobacter sp. TaxID=158749 RepID=UPI0025D1AE57